MTEIKAKLKYTRIAPRKVRLVVDLIRGMSVNNALNQLTFSTKKTAPEIEKLLKSALANAKNNSKSDGDGSNLYIKTITVNEGPTLKRMMPRARGSAYVIRKRSSTIELVLEKRDKVVKVKKVKEIKKK